MPNSRLQPSMGSREAETSRRHARNRFLSGVRTPRVSVVIPARNEALNLPWVLQRLPETIFEVILVDGHSTDNTVEVTRSYRPDVRVLTQAAAGKGAALATGLLAAHGDIVVMIDADGSMDPIEIHGLVGALLSGADVVKSSRYIAGGGSHDLSRIRSLGNKGLNIAAKIAFGHHWSELCYGMAAFWTDIIPVLSLEEVIAGGNPEDRTRYGRGFEIETLLFTRSLRAGLRVAEVPSFEYPRRYGESNLSAIPDGFRVLYSIFHERLRPIATEGHITRPILIVGSGSTFLSGISHYTQHLATALSAHTSTAVLLMRRLIPRFLYPGKARVGDPTLASHNYPPTVPVYDGVDWFGGRTMVGALRFIQAVHPRIIIFQWWTAAVGLHYVHLAHVANKRGIPFLVEFHEVQDVGEATIPFMRTLAQRSLQHLLRHVSGVIVHSQQDAERIHAVTPLPADTPVFVIPHGPYIDLVGPIQPRQPLASTDPLKVLFFGVIRPYKGLPDLVAAWRSLRAAGHAVELHIVGEPWDDASETVLQELRNGPDAAHAHITDRFIPDEDIAQVLAAADVLVQPYLRSSASGPIALAMAAGMPVVTTDVPALREVTADYSGALIAPVGDPAKLAEAILDARSLVGQAHDNPLSWEHIAERYLHLVDTLESES